MITDPAQLNFEEARTKGELHKYFGGYIEYHLVHPVADMPTDDAAVILPIKNIAANDSTILDEVHAAWLKLAEDQIYGWFVIYYFAHTPNLTRLSGREWLPEELVAQIAERLRANKAAYMALKRWHGETLEDGCWGMLWAENRRLHKSYNITVLPEEL
jgi:hypothetical protein